VGGIANILTGSIVTGLIAVPDRYEFRHTAILIYGCVSSTRFGCYGLKPWSKAVLFKLKRERQHSAPTDQQRQQASQVDRFLRKQTSAYVPRRGILGLNSSGFQWQSRPPTGQHIVHGKLRLRGQKQIFSGEFARQSLEHRFLSESPDMPA